MSKSVYVQGWCDSYLGEYRTAPFNNERRRALIECIKKRKYSFNHADHLYMSYCAPIYNDKRICILNKQEFDDVMKEVYKDIPRGARLMPIDVIDRLPKDGILYEHEKYMKNGGDTNE